MSVSFELEIGSKTKRNASTEELPNNRVRVFNILETDIKSGIGLYSNTALNQEEEGGEIASWYNYDGMAPVIDNRGYALFNNAANEYGNGPRFANSEYNIEDGPTIPMVRFRFSLYVTAEDLQDIYDNNYPAFSNERLLFKTDEVEYYISNVSRYDINIVNENREYETIYQYIPTISVRIAGQETTVAYEISNEMQFNRTYFRNCNVSIAFIKIRNFNPKYTLRYVRYNTYNMFDNGRVKTKDGISSNTNEYIIVPMITMTPVDNALYWQDNRLDDRYCYMKVNNDTWQLNVAEELFALGFERAYGFNKNNEFHVHYNFGTIEEYAGVIWSTGQTFELDSEWKTYMFGLPYLTVDDPTNEPIIYLSLAYENKTPGPGPDPGGDEPADDPDTDYTPPPGDGEEQPTYPPGEVIGGLPAAVNGYRPGLANYIFRRMRYTNIDSSTDYNELVAASMINDVNAITLIGAINTLYTFITGKPEASDVISRVYMLPFEYDEILGDVTVGHARTTPYMPWIGYILRGYNASGDKPVFGSVHYYRQLLNKFKEIDLGSISVQRIFNNYLDYTETKYDLSLPYGAGQIDLDPNFLFNGVDTGTVALKGYLDFETGMLIIKVLVNNQLYYETSVNVAVDTSIYAGDLVHVEREFAKIAASIGATVGGFMAATYNKEMAYQNAQFEKANKAEITRLQKQNAIDDREAERKKKSEERIAEAQAKSDIRKEERDRSIAAREESQIRLDNNRSALREHEASHREELRRTRPPKLKAIEGTLYENGNAKILKKFEGS